MGTLRRQLLALGFVSLLALGACTRTEARPPVSLELLPPKTYSSERASEEDDTRCGRPSGSPWVLGPDSVGPISVTATFEHVRLLCPGTRDSVDPVLHKFAALVLPVFNGRVWIEPPPAPSYGPRSLRGPIGSIVVETSEVRTRDGLGVGSTLQDLRKRFGSMLVIPWPEVGFYAVPRADPRTPVLFFLGGFDAERVRGGWTEDTAAYSDSITGAAVVTRLVVSPVNGK